MSVRLGDTSAKLYLGDILIGGEGGSPYIPDFAGYLVPNEYGFQVGGSRSTAFSLNDFDIIFCFYYGGTPMSSESRRPAACGTAYSYFYYSYPSLEIDLREGSQCVWAGIPAGSEWRLTKTMPAEFVTGKNYVKMSYRKSEGKVTCYHGTDGKNYNSVGEIDVGSVPMYYTVTEDFMFGGNANNSDLKFPSNDNIHIILTECKLISQGTVIFGYTEE